MIGGIQHHADCSCLVCRLRRAEAERDALRYWNESVAVCRDHIGNIVDREGECAICNIAALESDNAALRAALYDCSQALSNINGADDYYVRQARAALGAKEPT